MAERRSPPFQPWELDAIRELRKTMTRRVMKPQPIGPCKPTCGNGWYDQGAALIASSCGVPCLREPHGRIGDVWALCEPLHTSFGAIARYEDFTSVVDRRPEHDRHLIWEWKHKVLTALCMPLYAARDFATLKSVRVERLQEMNFYGWVADFAPSSLERERALETFRGDINRREMAKRLWDTRYGKTHPWDSNLWVWVYEFGNYTRDPGRPMQEQKS